MIRLRSPWLSVSMTPLSRANLLSSDQGQSDRPPVARFEFDLATPFFEQLRAFFDALGAAPLNERTVADLLPLQGVYGLLLADQLVYVGKSDGPLADRLTDHRIKLSGRQNIDPDRVNFRAAYLAETWVPLAPEANLIRYYRGRGPYGYVKVPAKSRHA
ncbi:MAG: GIY-YIG nuclease family protein [Phycisphaeraceae bacterium]